MKKIYSLIFASAFCLFTVNANAAAISVTVGGAGLTFSPSTFTAAIGDVVTWTWAGGTHNVTSNAATVPAGAVVFASPTQSSGTFSYTIAVAGSYGYGCTLHLGSGMTGTFTVSAVGIADPAVDLLNTTAYPNPFKDKLTIKYNGIESFEIINIVGDKVRSFNLSPVETKAEVDLSDLSAGVYFIRTYNEGTVVETKKIVKAK